MPARKVVDLELAVTMLHAGKTLRAVAAALEVHEETLRRKLRTIGFPKIGPGGWDRSGSKNPSWNGGRRLTRDGYVLIYCPDHPAAPARSGCVPEHRLVMERKLGRYLAKNEVVHHIDGNRQNNVAENLRLYQSNGQHLAETLRGRKNKVSPEGREKLQECGRRVQEWWRANPNRRRGPKTGAPPSPSPSGPTPAPPGTDPPLP